MKGRANGDIRVVIVDDQRTIREGLALLIGSTAGFRCTGVFADMERALPFVEFEPPDVLLVDLGLPGMSGTEGIRTLCHRHPALCIVVLTVYEDDERIFEALCAGACGCVSKKTPPERLIASLRQVVHGGGLVSPDAARRLLGLLSEPTRGGREDWTLDAEESGILRKLAQGYNLDTAADALGTSTERLATEVRRVYDKLHLFSRLANSGT